MAKIQAADKHFPQSSNSMIHLNFIRNFKFKKHIIWIGISVPEGRKKASPVRKHGESSPLKYQPRTGRQKQKSSVSPSSRAEGLYAISPTAHAVG